MTTPPNPHNSTTNISRFPPSKHTKSYLNRPDPVRQQSQARRRNLIKKSLQAFLAGDDKTSNSVQNNSNKDRSVTRSRERNRNPNCISSIFLSPRQKQRAKARKEKQKDKDRATKINRKAVTSTRKEEETTESKIIDLNGKLSESQETVLTVTVGNSSFDSIRLEPSQLKADEKNESGKLKSPLRTTKKKMKKYGFTLPLSPRKLLSPGRKPRTVVLSEDGMAKTDARSSATIIQRLPIADEVFENSQICFGNEEDLLRSPAMNYIDETDWAQLEWNAILPPGPDDYNASMRSSRSEMPRRRGSMTHNMKTTRRASCSGSLHHDRAQPNEHSRSARSPRGKRAMTRTPCKQNAPYTGSSCYNNS